MADLYGVSADFLPGRCESHIQDSSEPISLQSSPAFHGRPVWSAAYGWLLVNAADRLLTFFLNGLPNIQFLCSEVQ